MRSRQRFREAMTGAYVALDRLRGEGVVAGIGVGVNEAEMCVRFAQAGIVRHHAARRALLAAGAAGAGALPAAGAATGNRRPARRRLQFRHPGDRRRSRRQIQLSGCAAARSWRRSAQIERVCDGPWRCLADRGAAFRPRPSRRGQRRAGRANPAGGRAQRGRALQQGAGRALERSEGRASARCGCARSVIGAG